MAVVPTRAVEVFYTYAPEDETLRDELEKHLSNLQRRGFITSWHDRRVVAGQEWAGEIDEHLNTAQVILLLISPDFMASDYCYSVAMKRAMERHDAKEALVIPIILRPVDWQGTPFEKLTILPPDAKPVTVWNNRDEAFFKVARGIRQAIESLNKQERIWAKAYVASLLTTGVPVPLAVSGVTVGLYLSSPPPFLPSPVPSSYSLLLGVLFTVGAWLVIAAVYYYFATPRNINIDSYRQLDSRVHQLQARLDITALDHEPTINEIVLAAKMNTNGNHSPNALREAATCYVALRRKLKEPRINLRWVLGLGYVDAWRTLHRAEEALIEVESTEMVVLNARRDRVRIQGSTISNRDELLNKLMQAITTRDSATTSSNGNQSSRLSAEARAALREVSNTINNFQDDSLEVLFKARNQLMTTVVLTGFVTYILLAIAILTLNRTAILAGVVFYLIGAIGGMFGRLYNESKAAAMYDYGLSLARLIVAPPLAGLAGVGGVLITAILNNTLLNGQDTSLQAMALESIFNLEPRNMIVAAIFGLTPALLINNLQRITGQRQFSLANLLSNLESTEEVE